MYVISINTKAFRPFRCSKKNWEPGTINSIMQALDEWSAVERSEREVEWRINLFLTGSGLPHEGDEADYQVWVNQPENTIPYMDEPCGVRRETKPECPGFHQGYCRVSRYLRELKENRQVRIPFSAAYDVRQYNKNLDGCYMFIRKL